MDEKKRILLVDDDPGIRNSLSAFLSRAGFEISLAQDGQQALDLLPKARPDLIILDVMMPHLDGRETLRRLRRAGSWRPVILLTQVGEATKRAMALEEGADDYLNKPFEPHELVARIRAVLRRASAGTPPLAAAWVLISGALQLDRRTRRATLQGREINLTPKALILLEYLMTHPDELINRDRLLDAVWGWEQAVATRAVDARIAELRRALGDNADTHHQSTHRVKEQVARLNDLVIQLRKLAELETRPLENEPTDPDELLHELITEFQLTPAGMARTITLNLPQIPWRLPKVRGDADLLYLALHNVMGNAIKYTRPGDTIQARAFEDAHHVLVEIVDTGPGMPEEEQAHVWEELFRGKSARGTPGSGLGLTLVKTIIERHGGQVTFRSRLNQGTIVTFRLPVHA